MLGRCSMAMIACTLTLAPAAQAGTVTVEGSTVRFAAAPGEANQVLLDDSRHTRALVIQDANHPVTLGLPATVAGTIYCQEVGDAVHCRDLLDEPFEVHVALGDRDDRLVSKWPTLERAEGGDGNDAMTVEGPSDYPTLVGGAGNDRFDTSRASTWIGKGWSATVIGNAGDDFVRGYADGYYTHLTFLPGPGADGAAVSGDGGFTWLYDTPAWLAADGDAPRTQGVHVTMDGIANDGAPGEGDDVPAGVYALYGTEAADVMEAGRGAGWDAPTVHGLGGDDRLFTRDGVRNSADCGEGTDVAVVDAGEGGTGCETVDAG